MEELDNNSKVNGILVQLPLPNHINEQKVLDAVRADKDVDGLHPTNIASIFLKFHEYSKTWH